MCASAKVKKQKKTANNFGHSVIFYTHASKMHSIMSWSRVGDVLWRSTRIAFIVMINMLAHQMMARKMISIVSLRQSEAVKIRTKKNENMKKKSTSYPYCLLAKCCKSPRSPDNPRPVHVSYTHCVCVRARCRKSSKAKQRHLMPI